MISGVVVSIFIRVRSISNSNRFYLMEIIYFILKSVIFSWENMKTRIWFRSRENKKFLSSSIILLEEKYSRNCPFADFDNRIEWNRRIGIWFTNVKYRLSFKCEQFTIRNLSVNMQEIWIISFDVLLFDWFVPFEHLRCDFVMLDDGGGGSGARGAY